MQTQSKGIAIKHCKNTCISSAIRPWSMQATKHATQYQNMAKTWQSNPNQRQRLTPRVGAPDLVHIGQASPGSQVLGQSGVLIRAVAPRFQALNGRDGKLPAQPFGCSLRNWQPLFCSFTMSKITRRTKQISFESHTNMHRYPQRSAYRTAQHLEKPHDDKHKRRHSKWVRPGQKSNKHRGKYIFTVFRLSWR